MIIHKLGKFPQKFIQDFGSAVIAKRAAGAEEIEGKEFEKILCKLFGVAWKGSNDGLTDVEVDRIGYSVKSRCFQAKSFYEKNGNLKRVSTILGRCSPDTFDGSHIEKLVTPPDKAGAIITNIWNSRLEKACNKCDEFRQITILKSKNLSNWLIFEFNPFFIDSKDFVWSWEKSRGKKKKCVNLYGSNKEFHLTWQPNGAQFTLNMQIPTNHTIFTLPIAIPIISEESILEQIKFDSVWIKINEKVA